MANSTGGFNNGFVVLFLQPEAVGNAFGRVGFCVLEVAAEGDA